jgi:hydrogenase maturation protein HypF
MAKRGGARIHVSGVVQGVGFRPFVYGLAQRLALTGWVRNTAAGVDIAVDGPAERLATFARALAAEAPPLARVEAVEVAPAPAQGFDCFEIASSEAADGAFQPVAADVAVCAACLAELNDPADRRYRYPFINCTHCGPRFTIIGGLPYDRPQTTMAPFAMCPECAAEYHNPADRRFHAQPVACPACGPRLWLEDAGKTNEANGRMGREQLSIGKIRLQIESAIRRTRELLAEGRIVAVKGLGGYHLACDAANAAAVGELRRRKGRLAKPFALMVADLAAAESLALLSPAERKALLARERPIVVVERRPGAALAGEVAPGQRTVGLMLPYTPLHSLLLERAAGFPVALVMTSGNQGEEPIVANEEEARQRLAGMADAFLMHDRAIYSRCDDSVVRVFPAPPGTSRAATIYPLRRSRGYAPDALRLPWTAPPILAAGAELKNTFCLGGGDYAVLSQHIGDLENFETLRAFETAVAHAERLFRLRPAALAHDLHPDYLATRYALERAAGEGLPAIGVQHHHAHIAAAMADNSLDGERPVVGVAFDGAGYGEDGATWGGELLLADYRGYRRAWRLAEAPLPGGDRAAREPWRMALAWLRQSGEAWAGDLPPLRAIATGQVAGLERLLAAGEGERPAVRLPRTSSMGRLFDAVAALAGVRQVATYEGQAAVELEALIDPAEAGAYAFDLGDGVADPRPLIRAVVADIRAGSAAGLVAARFHNGVAALVVELCRRLRRESGPADVVLSGGVWQNAALLARAVGQLEQAGFTVYVHNQVPANDGGLALGQLVVAAARLRAGQNG